MRWPVLRRAVPQVKPLDSAARNRLIASHAAAAGGAGTVRTGGAGAGAGEKVSASPGASSEEPLSLCLSRPQHRSSTPLHTDRHTATEDTGGGDTGTGAGTGQSKGQKRQRPSYVGGVNILNNAAYRHALSDMPRAISIDNFDFALDGMNGAEVVLHMVNWTLSAAATSGSGSGSGSGKGAGGL